jgi:isoleucyl-tRNA synthetase
LLAKWSSIRSIRAEVLKQIEARREAGAVGSSLQAEVDLTLHGERHAVLATLGDELRFVMITSRATLHKAADVQSERIEVAPSAHTKCDRCWHWRPEVGRNVEHPTLCGRCIDNLFGGGEPRRAA